MIKFLQFCSIIIPVTIMIVVLTKNLDCPHLTRKREVRDWTIIIICFISFVVALNSTLTPRSTTVLPAPSTQSVTETICTSEDEVTELETTPTESETVLLPETETETETEEGPVYKSLGVARITAYCSCKKCCGKWADRRPLDENGNPIVKGASGAVLIPEYSVAVDPKVIPYGTKIYIDGKEYIAHDCGGAIDGNDIDIYFDSHEKALKWGAKRKEIFILVEEEN